MCIKMDDKEFSASQMDQLRKILTCTNESVNSNSIRAHVPLGELLARLDQFAAVQASMNRMLLARQYRKKYGEDPEFYS
jgi:hypothetical protein